MRRRGTPELLVATLILVLIGWYVWYTHSVYVDLQAGNGFQGPVQSPRTQSDDLR